MAVRTVEFKVSESGILPSSQQFGGVQGEHRATCVSFTLEEDLFNKISASSGGNRVVYRFDAYDGAGGVRSTEPLDLVDGALEFYLEEWQTRFGGNVSVFLVITEIKDDSTEMELYSFPAVLRLKNRPDGEAVDGENYESVSTLAESAKNSAKNAFESAEAASESLDELLASVPRVDVLEVSDGVEITVTEKNKVSVAKVRNGKDGADGKDGKDADLSPVANALKGSASGQGYVVAKDVSPLEHKVKMQLSNSSGGGVESVSQTATLNGTTRELLLDEPSSKVHVKFEQVDTYCDGAIVPLVDGEDLKAVSEVIFTPASFTYGEDQAIVDIVYTISGDVLSWKGTASAVWSENTWDISGSYTLSSSGQKIIGFYQIYDRPEDNPDYSDGGEMENTLDIIVSVYKGSFLGVPVTVGGKNLFDVTKNCAVDNISSSNSVTYDGDIITTNFKSGLLYINNKKKVVYPAGTYILTVFPMSENVSMSFWTYDSNGGSEKFLTNANNINNINTPTSSKPFTIDYDFAIGISGNNTSYGTHSFKIQVERGTSASEFEPYVEPVTYTANADGSVDGVKSVYPSTSVSVEDASTVVSIEYNRDINKAFAELSAAIISLGGNV